MPNVADLVKVGENCLIHHPICGWVAWMEEEYVGGSQCLQWVIGRDTGRPLVVDESILFDDEWTMSTFEELEEYYKDAPSFQDYKRPEWGQPKNAQP